MERRLGAVLPRDLTGSRRILDFAVGVGKLGFDYVVAYDHVVLPGKERGGEKLKYSLEDKFVDPLVLLAGIAALAPKLELFTGVLVLPQRQTVLVARQSADVDILCEGRLRLGVGVGWNREEYRALGNGASYENRGRRIEEQIGLLRQLWTQEKVTFKGLIEDIEASGLNPRPVQQPIPIWMGGTDSRVINRIARIADGWIPRGKAEEFEIKLLPQVQRCLEEQQRDRQTLPIMGKVNIGWEFGETTWEKEVDSWLRMESISHLSISTTGGGLKGPDEYLELLRRSKVKLG